MNIFKKHFHLVPRDNNQWAIRKDGVRHDMATYPTFQQAWQSAWRFAQPTESDIFIHRSDGDIERRSTLQPEWMEQSSSLAQLSLRFRQYEGAI